MVDPPQHPPPDSRPDQTQWSAELLDAAVELMGRSGRSGRVRVRGASMLPTLRQGAELAVEFGGDAPRFGEMMVFRQQGVLVVHRCLGAARRGGWRSRGDGVLDFDPAVTSDRLVGRVVAARLDGRWWSFRGRRARVWAAAVALHDLGWGAATVVAEPFDRRLKRLGPGRPLRRLIALADRATLALAHRLTFIACHATMESPPG